MAMRITQGEIKRTNRQQIYDYIYRNSRVSQQDISQALHLSRPTVAANLAELEEDGLICRDGQQASSQIGRKAVAYSILPGFRVALGVELTRSEVQLVAVDLYAQPLRLETVKLEYANADAYYRRVCGAIRAFIATLGVPAGRVLGVGITMQGLVSPDGRTVVYGEILGCTGLKVDVFERWLDLPCSFLHDPGAAALSELWVSPELDNAIYLSLSNHLGAALIVHGEILTGRHGHAATFEHIQAVPDGEPCYCGKRGCWDTLCSARALLGDQAPEAFFAAARRAGTPQAARWRRYLDDLALLIESLHLVHDVDFILGGHLAPFITEGDMRLLYDGIRSRCPFDEADDFLHISKMPSHNIIVGVALPYVKRFLEGVGASGREPEPADEL